VLEERDLVDDRQDGALVGPRGIDEAAARPLPARRADDQEVAALDLDAPLGAEDGLELPLRRALVAEVDEEDRVAGLDAGGALEVAAQAREVGLGAGPDGGDDVGAADAAQELVDGAALAAGGGDDVLGQRLGEEELARQIVEALGAGEARQVALDVVGGAE